MKRIVIYVYNDEIPALRPLARALFKKGAQAIFHALKYRERVKADLVLTTEEHLGLVQSIFEGSGIPVQVIDQDAARDAVISEERPDAIPEMVIAPTPMNPAVVGFTGKAPEEPKVAVTPASATATVKDEGPMIIEVGDPADPVKSEIVTAPKAAPKAPAAKAPTTAPAKEDK